MKETMRQAGQWLLWSPARFMKVTVVVVVGLIVWGAAGAVLFGRGDATATTAATESNEVQCRRAAGTWAAAWVDKGTSMEQWTRRVQAATTARGGQWVPMTDRDQIPPNGTVGDVTVDGDACIALVTIGDRPWTVTVLQKPSGWFVDSWDDES